MFGHNIIPVIATETVTYIMSHKKSLKRIQQRHVLENYVCAVCRMMRCRLDNAEFVQCVNEVGKILYMNCIM